MIIYVSMANRDRWEDDIFFLNGIELSSDDKRRSEFHTDIQSISDRGREVHSSSNLVLKVCGDSLYLRIITESKDHFDRHVPVAILIKKFSVNDEASNLELLLTMLNEGCKKQGYSIPETLESELRLAFEKTHNTSLTHGMSTSLKMLLERILALISELSRKLSRSLKR